MEFLALPAAKFQPVGKPHWPKVMFPRVRLGQWLSTPILEELIQKARKAAF